MCYIKNFASTSTCQEITTYFYELEYSFTNNDRILTDLHFFRMGDSNFWSFMYDRKDKTLMVKFSLWLYSLFGEQFCRTCSLTWTAVSLSIVPSLVQLTTAMAASYVDLFKDIFFVHLIYAVTLENSSNKQDINSLPVVVFWSSVGSILMSEIGKLVVLLGSLEFYKWY